MAFLHFLPTFSIFQGGMCRRLRNIAKISQKRRKSIFCSYLTKNKKFAKNRKLSFSLETIFGTIPFEKNSKKLWGKQCTIFWIFTHCGLDDQNQMLIELDQILHHAMAQNFNYTIHDYCFCALHTASVAI